MIPERPLAVMVDEQILWAKRHIEVTDGTDTAISNHVPCVTVVGFTSGVVQCEVEFDPSKPPLTVECDLSLPGMWRVTDARQVRVRLEFSASDIHDGGFEDFARRFPLTMVMPQGGIVRGDTLWKPKSESTLLPVECLQPKVWKTCDIACEDGKAQKGLKNVQDALADLLSSALPPDTVIVKDHGSGEIADFIAIQIKSRIIAFYHCKATKKPKTGSAKPGVRVEDLYDVLGQACRNRSWVRSPNLFTEIVARIEGSNRSTAIVSGNLADLKKQTKSFQSNSWTYEIVAVQPGLHCANASTGSNVNKLLIATDEWLRGCEAKFSIWGS